MRDGFTLIEIMIALSVLAIIAALSGPFLYNTVMGIKVDSLVESAALGIRQLIVDARTQSIRENRVYKFVPELDDGDYSFKPDPEDGDFSISYSLPAEFSKYASLDPESLLEGDCYFVDGLFVVKDGENFVLKEIPVSIEVKPNDKYSRPGLEINIRNGLPVIEDGDTE